MIYIKGQLGFGDNIYARPIIRYAVERRGQVVLETPWPELYSDMPDVFPAKPTTTLRTQSRNVERAGIWWTDPEDLKPHKIGYRQNEISKLGLMGSLRYSAPWVAPSDKLKLDLPQYPKKLLDGQQVGRPYAVIRPVTVRKEWDTSARNCDPSYIQHAIHELNDRGFCTILLYDVDGDRETFVGEKPTGAHVEINSHESGFDTKSLISLCQHADLLVGPVGWLVPFGYASKVPTYVIHGGAGDRNHPTYLAPDFDPAHKVAHALPDYYDMSAGKRGIGSTKISNFERNFAAFVEAIQGSK